MILTVSDENGKQLVEVKKEPPRTHIFPQGLPEFAQEDIDAVGLTIYKVFIAGESHKGGLATVVHAFIDMDDGTTDELISMCMCDTYGSISGYKHIINGERIKLRKSMGLDCLIDKYGALRIAMIKKAIANYRKENKKNNGGELYADIIVENRHISHLYQEIDLAKDHIKIKVGVVDENKKKPIELL